MRATLGLARSRDIPAAADLRWEKSGTLHNGLKDGFPILDHDVEVNALPTMFLLKLRNRVTQGLSKLGFCDVRGGLVALALGLNITSVEFTNPVVR